MGEWGGGRERERESVCVRSIWESGNVRIRTCVPTDQCKGKLK